MIYLSIISLIIVFLIGYFKILSEIKRIQKQINFVNEFIEKLEHYVKNWQKDIEAYEWLIERADTLQSYMGNIGVAAFYHPPFTSFAYKNIQISTNILPDLRFSLERNFYNTAYEEYQMIRETCLRFRGISNNIIESLQRKRKKPAIWFIEGIRFFLTLPFVVLQWFGLLKSESVHKIESSFPHRLVTAVISIISVASSLVTIIDKWDIVVLFLSNFFSK